VHVPPLHPLFNPPGATAAYPLSTDAVWQEWMHLGCAAADDDGAAAAGGGASIPLCCWRQSNENGGGGAPVL